MVYAGAQMRRTNPERQGHAKAPIWRMIKSKKRMKNSHKIHYNSSNLIYLIDLNQ